MKKERKHTHTYVLISIMKFNRDIHTRTVLGILTQEYDVCEYPNRSI